MGHCVTGVRDGVKAANLFDDHFGLGRIGVGDVAGARPAGVELRQLLRQGVGCPVLAALCQGAFGKIRVRKIRVRF